MAISSMHRSPILQCDPRASYLASSQDIDVAINRVLHGERYILGNEVSTFETEFAAYIGARHALGVANGTDALTLCLKAIGISTGDIVITVSHTAVATIVAIRLAGAVPLFVDVDSENGLMDIGGLEETLALINSGRHSISFDRVKAIIPVHLYGRSIDMVSLCALAQRYALPVIEDCAQAHGATFQNKKLGSYGSMSCFSFYPTKNLGAIGDGGAITTSDPILIANVRLLREYGWTDRYISSIEGMNSRLDELQAAILRIKLSKLDTDNEARIAVSEQYRTLISNPLVKLPSPCLPKSHVYHQFAVRSPNRDGLKNYLKKHSIGTLVHYPQAVHQQPAYSNSDFSPFPLPNTEQWAREELSLPIYPQLEQASIEYIADAINQWDGSQ